MWPSDNCCHSCQSSFHRDRARHIRRSRSAGWTTYLWPCASDSQMCIYIAQGERLMEKTKMLELKSNWKKWTYMLLYREMESDSLQAKKGMPELCLWVLVDTGLRKTGWHYEAAEVRLGEKVALWSRNKCPPGKWVWVQDWSCMFPFLAVSRYLLGSMSSLVTGKAYQPSYLPTTLLIQKIAKPIQKVSSNHWSAWISAWWHICEENSAIVCICIEDFQG